jgi:hypothetical protein
MGSPTTNRKRSRELARIRQRRYREGKARIDFYPDERTVEVISRLRTGRVGGDASSIINRIIRTWCARRRPTPSANAATHPTVPRTTG